MKTNRVLALAARVHELGNKYLIEQLKAQGLGDITASCGDIFMVLREEEGLALTEVAKRIHRTKSTTSVMVDRLVKLGFVAKVQDENDARGSRLYLTDASRGMQARFEKIGTALSAKIAAGMMPEEVVLLERLLDKTIQNLQPKE